MKISLYAIGVLFFTTINQSCTNSSSSSDNKTDSVKPELKSNTADMPAKDQDLNKIINLALQQSKTIKAKLNKGDIITDMWEPYTGDFTGDNKKDVLIYYDLVPKGGNAIEEQGLLLYENMGSSVRFIKKYVPSYRFSFKKIENHQIHLTKEEYKDSDPSCCPSIHTDRQLTVKGNEIIDKD